MTVRPFRRLVSRMAPLPVDDVDTDQIIPAAFLKVVDKSGLAEGLFHGWRYRDDGSPNPEFPLNRPEHQDARILVAGDNFGCGSSREHAAWALRAYGFRAVLSTRFADIFRQNALRNGLLTVELPAGLHGDLMRRAERDPATTLAIDLEAQEISLPDGTTAAFEIDPFARHCLLHGLDPLGYLLDQLPAIEAYERRHRARVDTRSGAGAAGADADPAHEEAT